MFLFCHNNPNLSSLWQSLQKIRPGFEIFRRNLRRTRNWGGHGGHASGRVRDEELQGHVRKRERDTGYGELLFGRSRTLEQTCWGVSRTLDGWEVQLKRQTVPSHHRRRLGRDLQGLRRQKSGGLVWLWTWTTLCGGKGVGVLWWCGAWRVDERRRLKSRGGVESTGRSRRRGRDGGLIFS